MHLTVGHICTFTVSGWFVQKLVIMKRVFVCVVRKLSDVLLALRQNNVCQQTSNKLRANQNLRGWIVKTSNLIYSVTLVIGLTRTKSFSLYCTLSLPIKYHPFDNYMMEKHFRSDQMVLKLNKYKSWSILCVVFFSCRQNPYLLKAVLLFLVVQALDAFSCFRYQTTITK